MYGILKIKTYCSDASSAWYIQFIMNINDHVAITVGPRKPKSDRESGAAHRIFYNVIISYG